MDIWILICITLVIPLSINTIITFFRKVILRKALINVKNEVFSAIFLVLSMIIMSEQVGIVKSGTLLVVIMVVFGSLIKVRTYDVSECCIEKVKEFARENELEFNEKVGTIKVVDVGGCKELFALKEPFLGHKLPSLIFNFMLLGCVIYATYYDLRYLIRTFLASLT